MPLGIIGMGVGGAALGQGKQGRAEVSTAKADCLAMVATVTDLVGPGRGCREHEI